MITVATFFSDTMHTVDAVIGNFVNTAYVGFIATNMSMMTLLFTAYVMLLSYQFLIQQQQISLTTIMRHFIVLLCVYGLVMNWQLYNIFVYNIFTNEPSRIAQVLVNSAGHFHVGNNIAQVLDGIYEDVVTAAINLFDQATFSWNGLIFIIYGFLVFAIGGLMCIFALLLFIYAKMMMAIALALGPIFILFVLWSPTKNLFAAWLNKLITLALIPIVTSGILVLMLSVINVTLPTLQLPVDQQQFYGIAPFLGLSLTTTLILSQVFRICASLGSGMTLASISAASGIAAIATQKSGLAWAGRKGLHVAKASMKVQGGRHGR